MIVDKNKHITLAGDKKFKVYEWLKKNKKLLSEKGMSCLEAATLASTDLGFAVSHHSLGNVARDCSLTWKISSSGRKSSFVGNMNSRRIELIGKAVVGLYELCGY